MNNIIYAPKQRELLRLWQRGELRRINLLEGSVRSGKTWISLVLWAFWVATMPKDGNYLMVAKTLTSLRRNCLDLLQTLVGTKNFSYSLSKKEGRLFGRLIYLEGVNDARAESKIRGMTLQGAYCDELTLFSEDFFAMLLSRLSCPGAKLIATTNPDNPNHWLMKKYIQRKDELDMLVLKFLIDDNTFLDSEYVENLKKEYVGVFYDRYVRGLWVTADGAIYQTFANNRKAYQIAQDSVKDLMEINVAVDFGGGKSGHAFVATGIMRGYNKLIVLASERYVRADQIAEIDPDKLGELFVAFCRKIIARYGVIHHVYCDSAEQTLIAGLRSAARKSGLEWLAPAIGNALKTTINDRIRATLRLMAQGRFFYIPEECRTLDDALSGAVWNPKNLTEDERLDDGTSDIDTLDAFEYTFERSIAQLIRYER